MHSIGVSSPTPFFLSTPTLFYSPNQAPSSFPPSSLYVSQPISPTPSLCLNHPPPSTPSFLTTLTYQNTFHILVIQWAKGTSQPREVNHLLPTDVFVGCLTSQQHASVSQGQICTDNFTCYHTEIEVADQTFYLTQSQYTDTGLTSPSTDPITLGAWQGSHWSANF